MRRGDLWECVLECAHGEFVSENVCVDACPEHLVASGSVCVSNCASPLLLDESTRTCVSECPKGTKERAGSCRKRNRAGVLVAIVVLLVVTTATIIVVVLCVRRRRKAVYKPIAEMQASTQLGSHLIM